MPGKGRGRGRGRGNFAATPQKTSTSNSGEDFPSLPSDVQPKPMTPWSKPKATTPASSAPASSAPASTTPVPLKTPVGDIVEELAASSIAPVSSESAVTSKLTSAPERSAVPFAKEKSPTVVIGNDEFPAKRGRGTLGRPIRLATNHYGITLKNSMTIFQYDLDLDRISKFSEKQSDSKLAFKNKDLMKELYHHFMNNILPPIYRNNVVYNFSKNLYSLIKLPFEKSATYEMSLSEGTFRVKIQEINESILNPNDISQVSLQLLDLILTQTLNSTCTTLNRNFFTRNCAIKSLGFGVELWRGAYASVRPSEIGLTWNIDYANTAFSTCQNLLAVACEHYRCSENELGGKIKNDKNSGEIGASFMNEFKGRKIKTETGFRKKIMGFGPDSSFTFTLATPGKPDRIISIEEYMRLQYKINLKYPRLPCVYIGKENLMPIELCKTELSQKKNLNDMQVASIIKETAVRAPERMKYIDTWINSSGINNDPILQQYNVNLKMKMIELDGRVLAAPDIEYSRSTRSIVKSETIADKGSWMHANLAFANPVRLTKWALISMSFAKENQCYGLAEQLTQVGRRHGMVIPAPICITSTRPRPTEREIQEKFIDVVKKYHSRESPLNLVMVILCQNNSVYKNVKTLGDLKHGIATQILEQKTLDKINPMTTSNILLKINTKLNGRNFLLSPINRLFSQYLNDLYSKEGHMMIFGADVTHPSNNNPMDTSINSESIAAVTGSLDKECCYYAARLYAQKSPKGQAYEMIHDLDKIVKDLLVTNFEKNGRKFPQRIVFYRDGVSEGQFSLVLRHEINKIRQACQSVHPGYKPAVTFVVVQKRHHTRFIPTNPKDQNGRGNNVPPGTVVDNTIVSQNMFDYFLCSHSGIQGTSKPCRYFVLHDENDFSTNQMQLLSHYLCHIYSRCSKSVSCPAPAYYAHLAAFRGRSYLRTIPNNIDRNRITSYELELHPDIKNRMFYN